MRESTMAVIRSTVAENAVCSCDGWNSLSQRPPRLIGPAFEPCAGFAIQGRFYMEESHAWITPQVTRVRIGFFPVILPVLVMEKVEPFTTEGTEIADERSHAFNRVR